MLWLHPRAAPTEPVRCIYDFGLAGMTQGSKRVAVGEDVFKRCGCLQPKV
jgi:AraC-type transcriptional regulator N-terminus